MELWFSAITGLLVVAGIGFFLLWRSSHRQSAREERLVSLQTQLGQVAQQFSEAIDRMREGVNRQLAEVTSQMNQRLAENSVRLDQASQVVGDVKRQLGALSEASTRIFEVGRDIASLQEILRAPKIRGDIGELFLGNLLEQILPKDYFILQYPFKNGERVDAVVRLGNLVPIDAKFPLDNFKRMIETQDETLKKTLRREFSSDVKRHIDAIAAKYILPDEGTYDFALMYIPAENVYYELIIKEQQQESLSYYALQRKVVPVSPNSLYAYLRVIVLGLKGLQIEKRAQEILETLGRLQIDFDKFREEFEKLGKHLVNSRGAYESATKRLDRFSERLSQVEGEKTAPEIPSAVEDQPLFSLEEGDER